VSIGGKVGFADLGESEEGDWFGTSTFTAGREGSFFFLVSLLVDRGDGGLLLLPL
jgi:hypothetical protein